MRTAYTLFFVVLMGASAWANQTQPQTPILIKAAQEALYEERAKLPSKPLQEVTKLYFMKNSRVKNALKFKMKRRHPRWA